jgi:hypothetical protein
MTPEEVYSEVHDNFHAVGGRNLGIECDEDHGKLGLTYYLYAKICWEPTMSLARLKALRDRWIERSYGKAAFGFMSSYYDYMATDFASSYSGWGRAIHFIARADAVTPDGTPEKRRLNELKQFWYYYYLQDHFFNWDNSYKAAIDPAIMAQVKELLWKGQTSYINPLYCITWGLFRHLSASNAIPNIYEVCGTSYYDKEKKFIAPAHFTAAETAAWWARVVEAYPYVPVTMFKDSKLVDGKLGADVDLNNLTTIKEFAGKAPGGDGTLTYMPHHAVQPMPLVRATKDGDTIGLKVFSWPASAPAKFAIAYSVDRWDPKARAWRKGVFDDIVASANDGLPTKSHEVAVLTCSQTVAGGIYRFNVGSAYNAGVLSSLDFDTHTYTYSGTALAQGLTFEQRLGYGAFTPWYFYIPKGTTTLDVEVEDDLNPKTIDLYTGLPSGAQPWKLSRTVDYHGRGVHKIPLRPGEDGSMACLNRGVIVAPRFHSIPNITAKAPWMLMVPKDIAKADGLTGY